MAKTLTNEEAEKHLCLVGALPMEVRGKAQDTLYQKVLFEVWRAGQGDVHLENAFTFYTSMRICPMRFVSKNDKHQEEIEFMLESLQFKKIDSRENLKTNGCEENDEPSDVQGAGHDEHKINDDYDDIRGGPWAP